MAVAVGLLLSLVFAGAGCSEDDTLKVHRLAPDKGTYMGGDSVTIYGAGFQKGAAKGAKVYFGNTPAQVKGFDGSDKLRVLAPGGEVGAVVDVTVVFETSGAITLKQAYKYIDPTPLQVDDLTEGDKKDK